MVQSIVMRLAALALLLTLVAPSVARIACEWDCIEQRAAAHAASCHEEESGDGDSLTAASMTTCHDDRAFVVARGASLAANSAALVDVSTPLSSPIALSSAPIAPRNAAPPPGARLALVQLRI